MIDHTGVVPSDFARSKEFYSRSLSAIGYSLLLEIPASVTGNTDVAGFGEPPRAGLLGRHLRAVLASMWLAANRTQLRGVGERRES